MLYKIPIQPLPVLTSAYKIERKTVWDCSDDNNILVFVLDGECSFTILNKEIRLKKGEILFIPAGQEYKRQPVNNEPCLFIYAHFTTQSPIEIVDREQIDSTLRELCLGGDDREPSICKQNEPVRFLCISQISDLSNKFKEIEEIFTKIISENFFYVRIGALSSSLFLTQILTIIEKNLLTSYYVSEKKASEILPEPLRTAIMYIHQNYVDRISMTELSNAANVTPQHLIRLFRKHLNTSPVEYINRVKILHAVELLRSSNLTVKEISYKVGFDNPGYFSRLFTKIQGKSPSKRRSEIRNFRQ